MKPHRACPEARTIPTAFVRRAAVPRLDYLAWLLHPKTTVHCTAPQPHNCVDSHNSHTAVSPLASSLADFPTIESP